MYDLYGHDGETTGRFAGVHPDGFPLYEFDPADCDLPEQDDFECPGDLGPCDPADDDGEDAPAEARDWEPPSEDDRRWAAEDLNAEDWPDWTDAAGVELPSDPRDWPAWCDDAFTLP